VEAEWCTSVDVRSGRNVASEIEVSNMLVNLVDERSHKVTMRPSPTPVARPP
jgi:hypothetical protein